MTSATAERRRGLVGSLAFKVPCYCATTAAITLNGEQSVDGVTTAGSRVLVKNQASSVDNGIYDSSTGDWTRAIDADGSYDFVEGTSVFVTDGGSNGGTYWAVTTPNTITVGSSALTWAKVFTAATATVEEVLNIAALKALPKTGAARANTLGYFAAGDGGAGNYWLDATDTTTADNGGTVIVATDGGRWKAINKARIPVDGFGTVGNGVANDYTAIAAASAVLVAAGGGTLVFTPGKTYNLATPLTIVSGVTYAGGGRSGVNLLASTPGAIITSSTTNLFANDATTTCENVTFDGLWIQSTAGGGHIFDFSLGTVDAVGQIAITNCVLYQYNTGKSVMEATAPGGVFSLWVDKTAWNYMAGNSVPAWNIVNPYPSNIVIERCWSVCSSPVASGTYSIWIESTGGGRPAYDCSVRQVIFEQPGGGCVNLLSCVNSEVEQCFVDDLGAVVPANPSFNCDKGASGPASFNVKFKAVACRFGSAAFPDLRINTGVSGAGGFLVENCWLAYYEGVSTLNGPVVNIIGLAPTVMANANYTCLGGVATQDLIFSNNKATSKSYTIWNGYSGNNEGYLNIFQDALPVGCIGPDASFRWGGTAAVPKITMDYTGFITAAGKITASSTTAIPVGGSTGVGFTATVTANFGLFFGSSLPAISAAQGSLYLRSDGSSTNTRMYVCTGTTNWASVLTSS